MKIIVAMIENNYIQQNNEHRISPVFIRWETKNVYYPYMDVRVKFFLGMIMLSFFIVILGILVYLASTSGPLKEEPNPPFDPVSIDQSNLPDRNTTAETGNEEKSTEPEVIATVTIEDNQPVDKRPNGNTPDNTSPTYTIRMSASWSKQLHPLWYPNGAHLSPMVAWSHRLDDVVFIRNTLANDGIEQMAETGATSTLTRELKNFINKGHVITYSIGRRIDAPGEDSVEITLSRNAPRVSVVSMIAPSPDWFITAHNVDLFENGQWVERKAVNASLYDAGTDSGTTFTAQDNDTNPPEPITQFLRSPAIPIATFEFVRVK